MRPVLAAHVDLDARIEGVEWYLPRTEWEATSYPTQQAASNAAVRLCVNAGLPIITPLSRPTPKEK